MKKLLIFPFGGNAREALFVIENINKIKKTWDVLGFIDDERKKWGSECCGFKVLGGRDILKKYASALVLAVPGNPQNYKDRCNMISNLDIPHEQYATIIDTSVRIANDAKVGKNTLLMPNVVISCSTIVGNHCVILPNTVISHDAIIEDYSLIGSNVSISGSCKIGQNCYVGSGSRITNNISIGSKSLVGIGSCVVKDVPCNTVIAGNPAQRLER